ncbi:threonine synthase [Devosia rhizoryzae]|uniref:Threonine synthase n=1 Tax=Devosia rhizoryzae TaxID=2774137 RepID=A0ABX7C4H2_9HYPH|nr:threonine synthase [Devosia rhizoryzae]QQR38159.1 threonine synthase [Devosia rhizoryzae]
MQFVSTRGQAPALGFSDAVLAGLATDGGLYVPASWPQISSDEIASFAGKPYAEVAYAIISRFTEGEIAADKLKEIIDGAYATFRHPSIAPLVELEPGHFVLELFHGPTLAFKDVAMQFLSRIMDHILAERGQHATIVGATSGDTGSAAIEAFRGRQTTDIFILHPRGRTSEVQRRQMTTVLDDNVHNIAIEGTFDDCQDAVKAMFNHHAFRDRMRLSGVNSINWGRIVAQIVYYFTAAVSLGAPKRKVSFCVPTGNFGDIFAGYCAKQMGLPIERLVIATNANDILRRTLASGRYEMEGVAPTISPSMDIQISSNFERLLFESAGRDEQAVNQMMAALKQSRGFDLPENSIAAIRRDFDAGTTDETATRRVIAETQQRSGYLLDPHTAVGLGVALALPHSGTPMVTLGTAHPAKFPAAVKEASGIDPVLPAWMSDLFGRPERLTVLPNEQRQIEDFIAARSRA